MVLIYAPIVSEFEQLGYFICVELSDHFIRIPPELRSCGMEGEAMTCIAVDAIRESRAAFFDDFAIEGQVLAFFGCRLREHHERGRFSRSCVCVNL